MQVRYTIKIASDTKQVIAYYETDVKAFIDSCGSSGGIIAGGMFNTYKVAFRVNGKWMQHLVIIQIIILGVMLVGVWHFLTCQVKKQKAETTRRTLELLEERLQQVSTIALLLLSY